MTQASDRERVALIVDTGVDDALALAVALRHPHIQLEAVLTTWGNVDLARVNSNTLRVLDWLGASDVPVYATAQRPLVGEAFDASYFHGDDGLGGARLPATSRAVLDGGIDWLVERVKTEPHQLTVVCTGPFTALALAIQQGAAFVENVKEVVVMGGAAHLPGNTTPTAEYNVYADPEAAALVFDQRWPMLMVGLDVTNQVTLTRLETHAIANQPSREAQLVAEVTRLLFVERQIESMALHDPLAVLLTVEPSLVTTVAGPVVVETRGEHTRGQTIVDWRPRRTRPPSNTRVCIDVDMDAARAAFLRALDIAD